MGREEVWMGGENPVSGGGHESDYLKSCAAGRSDHPTSPETETVTSQSLMRMPRKMTTKQKGVGKVGTREELAVCLVGKTLKMRSAGVALAARTDDCSVGWYDGMGEEDGYDERHSWCRCE
jgi:hypothetical protein